MKGLGFRDRIRVLFLIRPTAQSLNDFYVGNPTPNFNEATFANTHLSLADIS